MNNTHPDHAHTEKTLTIQTDRALIRAAARSVRYAVVTVQAPVKPRTDQRAPIDVAFVLDRSGSMGGEKIVLARDAVLQGINMLHPDDRFTVVAYDDAIDVVVPLAPATGTARRKAEALVRGIEPRGSTNLGDGWLRGCQQLVERRQDGRMSRCLLLSDGQANQGLTDAGELARHAADFHARGIVTSTFGVGEDFDELLMTGMSRAGGGHGYFMRTGAEVADLLTSELGEGLETVATDAVLALALPDEVELDVLSGFDIRSRVGGDARVGLGNLVSGQELPVVLRLRFPAGREGDVIGLRATVHDKEHALHGAAATLSWTWASHPANNVQPRNRKVDVAVATIYAARARSEAVEMNRRGQFAQAKRRLLDVARRIEQYAGDCRELREIAARLRHEADEFGEWMTAMKRKQAYYGSMNTLQARSMTGKARRALYDAEAFDVSLQDGLPVFDCAGRRVLVDTGSPVSFGRGPLVITGRQHPLPAAFDRFAIDDIARHVGRLDAILGADVLGEYQCLLDVGNRRIVFSNGDLGLDGVSLRIQSVGGVPAAEIIAGGRTVLALLDTGARLSYMDPAAIQGAPVGRERDFHPLVGEFETDVYELPIEFAGRRVTGRFGILPTTLQQALATAHVRWIVGMDLLARFPMVFDLRSGRIKVLAGDAVCQMSGV